MNFQVVIQPIRVVPGFRYMIDRIYNKFPNHRDAINELLQKSPVFIEMCMDYEEICTWLDDYGLSKDQPSDECKIAWELMRDLEDEIEKAFKEAGY